MGRSAAEDEFEFRCIGVGVVLAVDGGRTRGAGEARRAEGSGISGRGNRGRGDSGGAFRAVNVAGVRRERRGEEDRGVEGGGEQRRGVEQGVGGGEPEEAGSGYGEPVWADGGGGGCEPVSVGRKQEDGA